MGKRRIAAVVVSVFALALLVTLAFFGMNAGVAAVYAEQSDKIYLGGTPVGVLQQSEGAVITKIVDVETAEGLVSPVGSAGGRVGDIIVSIDGSKVSGSEEIRKVLLQSGDTVILKIRRNKSEFELAIKPAKDIVLKEKKLGILMKDSIAGVGTMTFIRQDLTFGALGHRIYDNVASDKDVYRTGKLFPCNIIGYVKGVPGEAGELRGAFNRDGKPSGSIEKNIFCGIFGKLSSSNEIVGREMVSVGHKDEIEPGKAQIFTTLNGKSPSYYDIEIVKTTVQNQPKEKSMVIRVTDKTLLKETGGIVQGMSGSPILQNGKIVGAVTHVFVNDPTSGYGIYIDWMLRN